MLHTSGVMACVSVGHASIASSTTPIMCDSGGVLRSLVNHLNHAAPIR
jgi:hypothetical protein